MVATLANHPARLAAVAEGQKRFDTGEPCAKGHSSPRYTRTGVCVECNRLHKLAQTEAKIVAQGRDPDAPRFRGRPSKSKPDGWSVRRKRPKAQEVLKLRQADDAKVLPTPRLIARAIAGYGRSVEARERSEYLDKLTRRIA